MGAGIRVVGLRELMRHRGLGPKLLLAATSLAVFAGILELGARRLVRAPLFYLGPRREDCVQRDWLLGLSHIPSCVGNMRGTPVRTNALGLRDEEVRDDGATRILALGDSCTWGWRVLQDQSYPAVLQHRLEESYGAGRYRVINAGFPGRTSYHGLTYLRERGLVLRPAIVIIGFEWNDFLGIGDVETRMAKMRRLMPLLRIDDLLLYRSIFYRWLRYAIDAHARPTREHQVSPERYQQNLSEMIRLAREHGAKPLLLIANFIDVDEYQEAARDVSARLDVPAVRYEGPRIDIGHPTAEGYQTLARRLLDRMREEGYLPRIDGRASLR